MRRLIPVSLLMFMAFSPANAVPAPKIAISNFDQLAHPLPMPYNERAHAEKAVAEARAKAKKANKLLLILGGMFDQPDLKRFMDKHYEIVTVDVGRFNKNLSIPAHYGLNDRLKGAPTLLIVDPKTDKLLNPGHVTALADARSMTPQAIADWLAQWVH